MPRISALPKKQLAAIKDELPIYDPADATTKTVNVGMIMPAGAVIDYAGPNAPQGWLFCFGQTLNATANPEYADLYAAIGNIYGGTSIADFMLPDLRDRVIAGKSDMGGISADRLTGLAGGVNGDVLGATGGAQAHTLSTAEMPSHSHNMGRGNDNNLGTAAGQYGWQSVDDKFGSFATDATGGGGAHNNVQPTMILNKIMKY